MSFVTYRYGRPGCPGIAPMARLLGLNEQINRYRTLLECYDAMGHYANDDYLHIAQEALHLLDVRNQLQHELQTNVLLLN